MGKVFLIAFVQLCNLLSVYAQTKKPVIDFTMLGTWPDPKENAVISADGKYTAFVIGNLPVGANTLVMQDVKGIWRKEFISRQIDNQFYFSSNSKMLCWKKGDSLMLQDVRKETDRGYLVDLYKFPLRNKGEWIVYREKRKSAEVVLLNLTNNNQVVYQAVEDALFDESGKVLLLQCKDEQESNVKWVDLPSGKAVTIWQGRRGAECSNFQFDAQGRQIVFVVNDGGITRVYYYKKGMSTAEERLNEKSGLLLDDLKIDHVSGFSRNTKWFFVKLRKPEIPLPQPDSKNVSLDIWSYRDEVLNPQQALETYRNAERDLVMPADGSTQGILLNPDGLRLELYANAITGDHCLASSDTSEHRESWWPHSPKPESWLVSLASGSRVKLPFHTSVMGFSPSAKWLIGWVNAGSRFDYYCYEISTGRVTNLAERLPTSVAKENMTNLDSFPVGIAGWFKDDKAVLVYDNYDIWKIDPCGEKPPVNFTNEYGKRNNIKLRLLSEPQAPLSNEVFAGNEILVLSGYNETNKYNGFLKIDLRKPGNPEVLGMYPFTWYKTKSQYGKSAIASNDLIRPQQGGKGKDRGWVLMGESATEFSNYYYSQDLKTFTRLSNLCPQKGVNWLTTELVSWKMQDGEVSQGILYKPEDFDSTKKYPVIFNYYERLSGWMYSFRLPQLTRGTINIPWFVSRGYLVFTPDINFLNGSKTGITGGDYACMSIISAAEYLIKRPYVDKEKMGIQGHSFGGLLTNYILTHSNLFAAAAEGAGFTDIMSAYLTLNGNILNPLDNRSTQSATESGHRMYGATPWQKPELYLKSSPVWNADKASAPLLILHNKLDDQVQWRQGVEMYMALRRLGKPCWMLQYDNGGHGVSGKDAKDFTMRLTQYFDHYLKNAPAPSWMSKGIPAKLKQVETGFALDPAGNCSKDCKVCKYWNEKTIRDAVSSLKAQKEN